MAAFCYSCPHCGQKLDCDDSLKNKSVPCPTCKKTIILEESVKFHSNEQNSIKPAQIREVFQKPIFSVVFEWVGYFGSAIGVLCLLCMPLLSLDESYYFRCFYICSLLSEVFIISGILSLTAAKIVEYLAKILLKLRQIA